MAPGREEDHQPGEEQAQAEAEQDAGRDCPERHEATGLQQVL